MKKRNISLIILCLIILAMLLSCSSPKDADWTILIYMAADNGLNTAALNDIEEMMTAEFSDDINVIVQIDESQYSESPAAKRYRIHPDSKNLISNLGEIDSGDYNSLTDFANWGFNKYPSDKKALFIWSHGNGWYPLNRDLPPSFCPDEESNSFISISDKDFQNALKNIDNRLDILLLDACNMQTLEVINEIYKYTDFFIAAEDAINTAGFPYHLILSDWENYANVQNLAHEIAFDFHYYYWLEDIYPISCSVVKTSAFPELLMDIAEFSNRWAAEAANDIFQQSREACLEFNDSWPYSLAADVDVKEFFSWILEYNPSDSLAEFCDRIITDIDSCFIFQKTDDYPTGYTTDNVGTGIIWFPDAETFYYFEDRLNEYYQLDFSATGWQIFVGNSFTN
ncbi:MAG: clostripain-related cysteine peptidase [Candidatus Cloacimonadales bacterium]|nr:clostripain-related cysteine peptidase [Candidatus Cloacimonadales bacterium]